MRKGGSRREIFWELVRKHPMGGQSPTAALAAIKDKPYKWTQSALALNACTATLEFRNTENPGDAFREIPPLLKLGESRNYAIKANFCLEKIACSW